MLNFIQSKEKCNFKRLSEINTKPIINLYHQNIPEKLKNVIQKYSAFENNMHGFEAGVVYGKPNSILRECENSPGVWIFKFSNNINIYMFSDGFRKNNYKGTSYEVEYSPTINLNDVADSLELLFNDFQNKFKEKYPENHKKIKSLKF